MILVDTNIWGRIAVRGDALHDVAMKALQWATRNDQPAIAAQSLYEFWVVATRPKDKNGLAWPAARAVAWMTACRRACRFLPEDPRVFDIWSHLVATHKVSGKNAHDARLVAYMQLHQIDGLLTFNSQDFHRFGISIPDPQTMTFT